MTGSLFKGNFWSSDILSSIGYETIIQHLNNGRKNCKEFEDFLKERASIEEKYGKDLLSLSRKKPCGQSETNTLKRALDVFKLQIDSVAQSHIQLAQTLREEARKMEEFREKQKLQRKKVGFTYVLRCCHSSSRKFQACLFVKLLDPFPTLKHPHSSFNL
ncbi:proline-serine-threonine phosphatase-interacting protein 2 isoform X2 [Delphinapterus leucas]|uniref:Proline-serine-threonine phosphatase-interacting protein 2 isoform X2 n=1 Tax=Delphinapterus leucas TaxID=9749 RepID=A0A2Y9M8X2_DELLE|nr:proline-serine-threonine phosphatase-interacting protein 2 isoform X2 [Delphinapterus leucas]